jgi:hypothetical protein
LQAQRHYPTRMTLEKATPSLFASLPLGLFLNGIAALNPQTNYQDKQEAQWLILI